MSATPAERTGVWGLLRSVLDGGLAFVEKRVELVAVDLREEKKQFVETIMLGAAVIALGLMTLALGTLLVVVLFWENGRIPALAGLGALYLVATIVTWRNLRGRLDKMPLAATRHEIEHDRARIKNGD